MLRFAFSKTCVALSLSRAVVLREKKGQRGSHTQGPAGGGAGRGGGKSDSKKADGALSAGVSLPHAAVSVSSKSGAAAAAGGQPPAAEEHDEKLCQKLKDFFDLKKVSPREPGDAEKEELKKLALVINPRLNGRQQEGVRNTAVTMTNWEQAINAADSNGTVDVAKAVERFALVRFSLESFPPPGLDPTVAANLIVDFLKKSLVRWTLAEHLEARLEEEDVRLATEMYGCPILCSGSHIHKFFPKLGLVREWTSDVGDDEIRRAVETLKLYEIQRASFRRREFALSIGGENGSGKTIFAALAPQHFLAGRGVTPEKMKANTLTIYACADDGLEKSSSLLNRVDNIDRDLEFGNFASHTEERKLRRARVPAASAYLHALIHGALGCDAPLRLPKGKRYKHLFIIVDGLSEYPELFRSLLVGGVEQGDLLAFTKAIAENAQLICCATESRSFIEASGSRPGDYDAIRMGPSPRLFEKFLKGKNVSDAAIGALLSNWILAAVVANRLGATLAAEILLGIGNEEKDAVPKLNWQSSADDVLRRYAGTLACAVVRAYCRANRLCYYNESSATSVMLEGLRRLLLWDSSTQQDVDQVFALMGPCSPLALGTFSVSYKDVPRLGNEQPTHETVTLAVTTAQLAMAAVRYGAVAPALEDTAGSFQALSALMFALFLDAMRVVPRCTESEGDRLNRLENKKKPKNAGENALFASALRGTEEVPPVSLFDFLRALDGKWACGEENAGSPRNGGGRGNLKQIELTHTSVAPLKESTKQIQPPETDCFSSLGEAIEDIRSDVLGGAAVVRLNKPASSYADFFAVSGKVLFLVQCKRYEKGYGKEGDVKENLVKMGFGYEDGKDGGECHATETPLPQKWKKYSNLTAHLMKKLGCEIAVPLFLVLEVQKRCGVEAPSRGVVAVGHGWRGPVPFVHVLSGIQKSCIRKKGHSFA